MGQDQHRPNPRGHDRRVGIARKDAFRHLAALAIAAVAASSAFGQGTDLPVARFDKASAWKQLVKQVEFNPRVPGSKAHIACRDYLLDELKKYCDNARLQELQHTWSKTGQPVTMWNIIGEQNWKNAKIRVALFAHWDSRPTADMEPRAEDRAKPIPGANDGASGVAVLLELMRVLKDQKVPVGIQYVLTDGEDLGPGIDEMFLGASAYAKDMGAPRADYGILLDMIGDKDLSVPIELNSWAAAEKLCRALYRHAGQVGLGKSFPMQYGQDIEDDHIPLIQAGLPTIDLIDFTYRPWHTLADTPDKCSPESLGKVGTLLETWLTQKEPFDIKAP